MFGTRLDLAFVGFNGNIFRTILWPTWVSLRSQQPQNIRDVILWALLSRLFHFAFSLWSSLEPGTHSSVVGAWMQSSLASNRTKIRTFVWFVRARSRTFFVISTVAETASCARFSSLSLSTGNAEFLFTIINLVDGHYLLMESNSFSRPRVEFRFVDDCMHCVGAVMPCARSRLFVSIRFNRDSRLFQVNFRDFFCFLFFSDRYFN